MKKIKYTLGEKISGIFAIGLKKLLYIFPLNIRYKIFEKLGLLSYFLIKERRNLTINNIQNAFPEKNIKEIKKIAKNSYKTMGKMILTTIFLKENIEKNIIIENEEMIKKISENNNKSIILVSLHMGGFEGGSILQKFRPFYAVFREQKNKKINFLMSKWRKLGGLNPILKDDVEKLNEAIKGKNFVALASDHAGGNVKLEFFNRKVIGVGGPVLLGLKNKVPLVLAYSLFDSNNKIKVIIDKELEIEKKDSIKETVQYNMQKIYYEFERIIRENPDQYMWQHNRWR